MLLKNSNTDSLETLARLKLRQSSKPQADRYFTARSCFSILPIILWTKDDDHHGDVDSLGNYDNHANHAVDHDGRTAAADPDKDGDYCS